MSAELDIEELDKIADELPVQDLDNEGKKPSRAATAFCLALACCTCERVPAALFYRACQPRRQWNLSGELVDSPDHLKELPSWLLGLFRVQKAELSASNGTLPVAAAAQSTLPAKSSPSQDFLKELKLEESTPFYASSSLRTGISLELLGIKPDDVQTFATSDLLLPSDLQYLSDLQGFAVVTSEETVYFVLSETWKENILRTASEGLRICIWTLLATVAAYAMPVPYTEPLWPVFQFQLKEVIESTVMPFLGVLDMRDIQDWSYVLTEDILLLLIYHRCSTGTTPSRDSLGPEISQYLRTTTLHNGRLASIILLVEWLEVLISESRASKSNFLAHLESCSQTFLYDERLKFLILISIDSAVIPCGCTLSAEIAAALRESWIAHLVFAGRDVDTISQCLWQSFYRAKDQISVPGLMITNVSVKSALAFALAERQHYRQAQFALSTCLSDTNDAWPSDSPTRHLILTEFVNCSNLLGDQAQAESAARQAMQRSHIDNRFDVTCLKIALADSYISQCKYKMAIEMLTEMSENTSLSKDVLLRIALRLTKAKRRLARETAMPIVNTNLTERFVDAQENIPESLRIEYLEETLSIVVNAGRPLADALTVGEVPPTHEAIQTHFAGAPDNWRVDAIREALDSSTPLPFEDGDENTINNQQLPQDSSQAWDESVPEPGLVALPSGPYQMSRKLSIRVFTMGNSDLRDRVRGLSGPVMYRGSFVPSERSRPGDVTSAISTINISYQVINKWSRFARVDFAIVKLYEFLPRYTVEHGAYALRKLRIDLREAGFIGPVVAVVPSLQNFDDSIVNTIDGGYGRGYDGYLEEPLERERLAILIHYYCQARLPLGHGTTAQKILHAPLVFNDQPRMILLPADYRDSLAFAIQTIILYPIHKADFSGRLSLTLDYGLRLDHSRPILDLFRNDFGYDGFVAPTQAFRKATQSKLGYQMVCAHKTKPNELTFGASEITLSLTAGCGIQPDFLRTSETLDVNLTFEPKIVLSIIERFAIRLSSERMREYQVDSLKISRICVRRIIEQYTRTQTSGLIEFFAGTNIGEHGARYLVTGYRTYLNPNFTRISRGLVEDIPEELLDVSGDNVAAMQLCKISLDINNVIQPSEADIDFRNVPPEHLDSLQVHVDEPKWYVLWGPMSGTDELWPPSTHGRRRFIEDEVGDTYKIVVGQPDIINMGSRPPAYDSRNLARYNHNTTLLPRSPPNRTSRSTAVLSASRNIFRAFFD